MKKLFLTILVSSCMVLHAETLEVPHGFYFNEQVQKEILEKKEHLQTLKINGYFSAEPALLFLSASFPLESLDLNIWGGCNLEFSLDAFAPNLKHLILNDFFRRDWDGKIFFITSFKSLESLSIGKQAYGLPKASLEKLGLSLPFLKELSLHMALINADFTHFHALEKLDLSGSSAYPDGLLEYSQLSSLDNLKNLNLSYMKHDWANDKPSFSIDFRTLAYFKTLENLNLSGIDFTPENIEQTLYETMPNLKELTFNESNIRGAHFSTFAPNLTRLSLKSSNITGGDIAQIAQLGNLEFLDISFTSITGASIKKLAVLTTLKELSLGNTNMSKANFADLPPSIEILNLPESTLSIASFNSLSALTHLKTLDLRNIQNSNITQAMVKQLQEALSDCEILH